MVGWRAFIEDARRRFSALQRAEIAEILPSRRRASRLCRFSALQRAEIAEMEYQLTLETKPSGVSVLFNEPKLLKSELEKAEAIQRLTVSVLFNEPKLLKLKPQRLIQQCFGAFQCSSTSRNC